MTFNLLLMDTDMSSIANDNIMHAWFIKLILKICAHFMLLCLVNLSFH